MGLGIVGGIAVEGHGLFLPLGPIPGTVPVGLGEVRRDGDALCAEGVKQLLCHVRSRVRVEGAVRRGDLVGGIFAVVHAEAVVVLRGKDEIAKPYLFRKLRPLVGVEADGVEGPVHVEVLGAELFSVRLPGIVPAGPVGVAVADGPAFAHAQLAVGAPVHHEGQLLILEPFQLFEHLGLLGRNVSVRVGKIDDVFAGIGSHSMSPCRFLFNYRNQPRRCQGKRSKES